MKLDFLKENLYVKAIIKFISLFKKIKDNNKL